MPSAFEQVLPSKDQACITTRSILRVQERGGPRKRIGIGIVSKQAWDEEPSRESFADSSSIPCIIRRTARVGVGPSIEVVVMRYEVDMRYEVVGRLLRHRVVSKATARAIHRVYLANVWRRMLSTLPRSRKYNIVYADCHARVVWIPMEIRYRPVRSNG